MKWLVSLHLIDNVAAAIRDLSIARQTLAFQEGFGLDGSAAIERRADKIKYSNIPLFGDQKARRSLYLKGE